ncbi:hypothetical protein MACJ_002256 [Theileria orientalis]|uniref:Cyclin-dependent kinases regulatory subunit n=1 Tax=Theileria orientalis TaxID=68886 RepID=A0A976QSJ4_THEOR|nr:hypothetical protein MACJ_002256 [Theileria orientalis]
MANRRKKQDTSLLAPRSYSSHPTRAATNPNYRTMLRRDMKDRLNLQRSIDKIEKSIKASNASLSKAKSSVKKLVKEFKAGLENDYAGFNTTSVPNPFSRYGVITDNNKPRSRRKTNSEPTYTELNQNIPRMNPAAVDGRFTGDVPRDRVEVPPRHIYSQDELEHRMRNTGFFHPNSKEAFNSGKYKSPDRKRQAALSASRPYDPDFQRYNAYNPDYADIPRTYKPDYADHPREYRPEYSNTSISDIPDYAKTSIRDIPEYNDALGDMPEYVRTIRRDIPEYIESPREFRPDYIESSREFRPDYIEKSRSFISEYDENSIKYVPEYAGSSRKPDYLGSSVKADYVESSRSFIPEHPGSSRKSDYVESSIKSLDYVGSSNTANPEHETNFRQFRPDYGRNPSEYQREGSVKSSSLKFEDLLADAPRTEYQESTLSVEIEQPKMNFRPVEEVMKRMYRRTNNIFFDTNPSPPTQRTQPFAEDESQTEELAKNALLKLKPTEICRDLMERLEVLVTSSAKSPNYYARDKCSTSVPFPNSVLPLVKGHNPMSESTNATNSDAGSEDSDDYYDEEDSYSFNLRVYLLNYHNNNYRRINNYKNYKYISGLRENEKNLNTDKGAESGKLNDIGAATDNHVKGIENDKHTDNGTNENAKNDCIEEYVQRHKHIFNGKSSRTLAEDYIEKHKQQQEQRESNKRKRSTRFFSSGVSPLDLQDLSLDTSPTRLPFDQTLEENLYDISTSSAKRAMRKTNASRKSLNPYNMNDEFMLTDSEDYAFIETRFGRILYSPKIHDDKYMYRFIVLTNEAQNAVDMLSRCSRTLGAGTYNYKRFLTESQIMHDLGIRMSGGWTHYFYFKNGHKELILRKRI